jgi:6-phosphogluconolactonase (cycloisomerase 2 family)
MEEQGERFMRQWARRAGLATVIVILSLTAGCGTFFVYPGSQSGGGSGSTTSDYVYVANQTTATVAGFSVGSGTLTALSGSPYTLGYTPVALAVNPSDSILFISGYTSAGLGVIYAYSIGSTGTLNILNNGLAVSTGYAEVSLDISPDGQWLLGLDANSASLNQVSVDEFQINSSTGALTLPVLVPYSFTGSAAVVPKQVKFSPNGQLVFVALGTAGDLVYTFNTALSSGALNLVQTLSFSTSTSDNAVAVSPSGSYVAIARSGTGNGLAVYAITSYSTGALSSVTGSPFSAGTQPYSVAFNQAGTDIYVADRSGSAIYGYSFGSGGVATALSTSPYKSGSAVTALAADKSGSYVLAAAFGGSPDLTMYGFDSLGNLVSDATPTTGTDPTGPIAIATTH